MNHLARLLVCAVGLAPAAATQNQSGRIPAQILPDFAPVDAPPPPRALLVTPSHPEPTIPVVPGRELPPGRETVPAVPAAGPATATIQVYRNTAVQVGSRSSVGEPTAVHNGSGGLMTGNWYAASTDNDGQTWNYLNPYTRFPASDGGFCCDQQTHLALHRNAAFWVLQYSYSATTQSGRLRTAVLLGGANLGNGTVRAYYDITPQTVGFAAGTWFDFPHVGSSEQWLYLCANVFDASSNFVGAAVVRLLLDDMVNGRTAAGQWRINLGGSSFRFANHFGPSPRMTFVSHVSTSSLRIYRWDDNGTLTQDDRNVSTWYAGTTNVAGPDGRAWTGRTSNRILGAWDNSVHVGFMWYSNAGGAYPLPHVRVAWFDRETLDPVGERAIWSSSVAWAYPCVAVNTYGHLGGTLCYGGGTFFPGTSAWIVDDLNCWGGFDNLSVAGGSFGPDNNRWGDYLSAQCDTLQQGSWLATAMSQVAGSSDANQIPRNVDFGRSNLSINYGYLDLRTAPAGIESTVATSPTDNFCRDRIRTPGTLWYRTGTQVTLTAEASVGGRQFHRWLVDNVPQPVGQRALALTINPGRTLQAVYGYFTAGSFAPFGSGCAGSGGVPAMGSGTVPEIGGLCELKVTNAPRNLPVVFVLGLSNSQWSGLPLPLTLPGTTCRIYTDLLTTVTALANVSGSAVTQVPLPNDVTLLGGVCYAQAWCVDPGRNGLGLTMSDGAAVHIGGWDLR